MLIILQNWSLWHYFEQLLMSRVFTNGPGDQGSVPYQVIPKIQKWYLMLPCLTLSIIRYRSMIKWSNPRNGVTPSPTPWKRNLQVALDCGHQLYLWREIQFLFWSFFFLTIFMLSHVISSQFMAWSIHTVVIVVVFSLI